MEDKVSIAARTYLPLMDPDERRWAVESVRATIDSELLGIMQEGAGGGDRHACPHCGCDASTKRRRDSKSRQRRLCSGCGRTSTSATLKIFSTTKLPGEAWMRFAERHVDMVPLRTCADRCGVYRQVLPSLGAGGHIATASKEHGINEVNNLHSNLKDFMGRQCERAQGSASNRLTMEASPWVEQSCLQ